MKFFVVECVSRGCWFVRWWCGGKRDEKSVLVFLSTQASVHILYIMEEQANMSCRQVELRTAPEGSKSRQIGVADKYNFGQHQKNQKCTLRFRMLALLGVFRGWLETRTEAADSCIYGAGVSEIESARWLKFRAEIILIHERWHRHVVRCSDGQEAFKCMLVRELRMWSLHPAKPQVWRSEES